jgi:hypothetical protein
MEESSARYGNPNRSRIRAWATNKSTFASPSPQTEGACPDCFATANHAFSETLDVLDGGGSAFTWGILRKILLQCGVGLLRGGWIA